MPVSRIRRKVREAKRKAAQIAASRKADLAFIALFNWHRERERQCGRNPKYRNSKANGRRRVKAYLLIEAWHSNVRAWEKKNPKPIYTET